MIGQYLNICTNIIKRIDLLFSKCKLNNYKKILIYFIFNFSFFGTDLKSAFKLNFFLEQYFATDMVTNTIIRI